ncbi:hypothetical protein VTN02DRAFT_132 [Thermoascus thermophilus]
MKTCRRRNEIDQRGHPHREERSGPNCAYPYHLAGLELTDSSRCSSCTRLARYAAVMEMFGAREKIVPQQRFSRFPSFGVEHLLENHVPLPILASGVIFSLSLQHVIRVSSGYRLGSRQSAFRRFVKYQDIALCSSPHPSVARARRASQAGLTVYCLIVLRKLPSASILQTYQPILES